MKNLFIFFILITFSQLACNQNIKQDNAIIQDSENNRTDQ